MKNGPSTETFKALATPSVQKVIGTRYKYRKVYLHLFHDEEDYFVGGFDPETRQVVAYEARLDRQGTVYGCWGRRRDYDELLERTSATGAELVWNKNFVPCRASSVPKIQMCDYQWGRSARSQ